MSEATEPICMIPFLSGKSRAHLKSQKACWPGTQSATRNGQKISTESGLTYHITANMSAKHIHSDRQTSGKGTACQKGTEPLRRAY